MTEREKVIATAYTGVLFVQDFAPVHKYVEEKLGRPVWMHEFASPEIWDKIKDSVKKDFAEITGFEGAAGV